MPNNVDGSTPNNSESDSQLGQIVVHHVGIVGIPFHELLVIFLGRIKAVERADLGDDRLLENLRVAELLDVSFGDALLFRILAKDRGTVLRAAVGALPVL